ncbi:MAG: protein-tyrosine-phosphatase [Sphingobacteriaceae bacterium]|nr:protein-tyrosine-phosphatase [Sphingobacteriaceae bacterium]
MSTKLYSPLQTIVEKFNFNTIDTERKEKLNALVNYIQDKKNLNENIRLNFICTHNSRRSHLSQVWAQTAAFYYNIKNVQCYSGGTEATEIFSMIVKTLENMGFQNSALSTGKNAVQNIKFNENEAGLICFSKKYDDKFNPSNKFAAILTCNQADSGCPFIAGAEKRIALPFNDPKEFDNSPLQAEKYLERSIEIGTELFYVFSQIK